MKGWWLLLLPGLALAGEPIGDLHEHVTMKAALPFLSSHLASDPDDFLSNQIDPEALRAAGVRVIFATVWPPVRLRPGRSALDEAIHQLDLLRALPRRDATFAIASNASELEAISASGRIALLPAVEGAEGIRKVEDVDALFAAGARSIGLTHFVDNAVGGAESGQFGSMGSLLFDGKADGLTAFGKLAVGRMMDLGIVVDVAHCSERTVEDVLQLAEAKRVPIISSHIGSGMAEARTITDDHARRIAAVGGLLGVGLYRHDALKPVPAADRFDGFVEGTCDEAISHWVHLIHVAGAEAVVLGSDFSSPIHRGRRGGSCPDGIRNTRDLPALFSALAKRGAKLSGSGSRIIQLVRKCEAAADPSRRSEAERLRVPRRPAFDSAL